ncbi:MAG TPA: CBS domain-containing protein [Polyangiaceae bacterium]
MNCEQVMKRNPKCLSDKDSTEVAAKVMRDHNVGFIPVCAEGKLVGTITDRDIVVRIAADHGALETPIGQFMSRDLVVCKPGDELSRVEMLMGEKQKSRVVCVDGGNRPVGVISLSDIAQHEDRSRTGELLRTITAREARHP